jgi:hypothetical protein
VLWSRREKATPMERDAEIDCWHPSNPRGRAGGTMGSHIAQMSKVGASMA